MVYKMGTISQAAETEATLRVAQAVDGKGLSGEGYVRVEIQPFKAGS